MQSMKLELRAGIWLEPVFVTTIINLMQKQEGLSCTGLDEMFGCVSGTDVKEVLRKCSIIMTMKRC